MGSICIQQCDNVGFPKGQTDNYYRNCRRQSYGDPLLVLTHTCCDLSFFNREKLTAYRFYEHSRSIVKSQETRRIRVLSTVDDRLVELIPRRSISIHLTSRVIIIQGLGRRAGPSLGGSGGAFGLSQLEVRSCHFNDSRIC